MSVDHKRAMELAELAEATAEELERRANKLLKTCRELRREAGALTLVGDPGTPRADAPRTVTRSGKVVDERVAIDTAKALDHFAHGDFQRELGLTPSQTSRWLALLARRQHPVIARALDGMYDYLQPPRGSTEHPTQPAPEVLAIDSDQPRGTPIGQGKVRRLQQGSAAQRKTLSTPGEGHRARQAERRRQAARNGNQ